MLQVALSGGEVRVVEVPEPVVRRGAVLVRTSHSLISAGTESAGIGSGGKRENLVLKALKNPALVKKVVDRVASHGLQATAELVKTRIATEMPSGYSCAGVVIEVGEDVSDIRKGDRVACAGAGHANHAGVNVVPRCDLVALVPDGVSFEEAAFGTLGAIALQGVRRTEPGLGDRVAVLGLGLLGQITVQMLKAAGAVVIGVDVRPDGRAILDVREHAAVPLAPQVALGNPSPEHRSDPVVGRVPVVESHDGQPCRPQHTVDLVNGACSVRRVMQHPEGVHRIEAIGAEGKILGVATQRPRAEALELEALASELQVSSSEIEGEQAGSRPCKLCVIGSETRTDLKDALIGKRRKADRLLHPGSVVSVALAIHLAERTPPYRVRGQPQCWLRGVCVPLPLRLSLRLPSRHAPPSRCRADPSPWLNDNLRASPRPGCNASSADGLGREAPRFSADRARRSLILVPRPLWRMAVATAVRLSGSDFVRKVAETYAARIAGILPRPRDRRDRRARTRP